jgi:hypothetical protein
VRLHEQRGADLPARGAGADKRITEAIDFDLQAGYSQGNDDGDATGALVPAG